MNYFLIFWTSWAMHFNFIIWTKNVFFWNKELYKKIYEELKLKDPIITWFNRLTEEEYLAYANN